MRKIKAFTLIELLVVVSIIALLIAILLPVLSNVQYASRTTICTTRLKQIGIGITAYAVDNQDKYPHKVGPIRDRYLYAGDGEYYRWDQKPWSIKSASRWNYIPMVEPYFSDLNEVFICPHIEPDWNQDVYSPSTNATIIPYAFYWGVVGSTGVKIPMTTLGEGWGPGNGTDGGGITQDSRYHILASDYIRKGSHGDSDKLEGNHPPAAGDYEFIGRGDGNGTAYQYRDTTVGNANYLYDDGSVTMEGQIHKENIGNNAEWFRNGGRWLVPTDRVVN